MASDFLGFWRRIHDTLHGKGKTIYGQYYASELRQLKEAIKLKPRAYVRFLLQDNAPIRAAQPAEAEAINYIFE